MDSHETDVFHGFSRDDQLPWILTKRNARNRLIYDPNIENTVPQVSKETHKSIKDSKFEDHWKPQNNYPLRGLMHG